MNIVLIVIGILAIIGGFVAFGICRDYRENRIKKLLLIPLVGLLLFIFGCSFTIVPTGYTGVRTTFGQISEEVVPHGFNMKVPFAQSIKLVNNKRQDVTLEAQVWGESTEKTPVYAYGRYEEAVKDTFGKFLDTNHLKTTSVNKIADDIIEIVTNAFTGSDTSTFVNTSEGISW